MIPETELAYAAGFFDGEGSLGIYKQSSGYFLQVSIGQLDPRPIDWIQERWPAGVIDRPNGLRIWRAYSGKGLAFLLDVLPYLMVKREQVLYVQGLTRPYREEHMIRLKEYKLMGIK